MFRATIPNGQSHPYQHATQFVKSKPSQHQQMTTTISQQQFVSTNSKKRRNGELILCRSALSDRLLSCWLIKSLVDIKDIHRRQNLMKLFIQNSIPRSILYNLQMTSSNDLLNQLRINLHLNNHIELKELVDFYNFIEQIPAIIGALNHFHDVPVDVVNSNNSDKSPKSALQILQTEFIKPLDVINSHFNNFQAMMEQCVDFKPSSNRQYLIKYEYKALKQKLVAKMVEITKSYLSVLVDCIQLITELDVILTLSHHFDEYSDEIKQKLSINIGIDSASSEIDRPQKRRRLNVDNESPEIQILENNDLLIQRLRAENKKLKEENMKLNDENKTVKNEINRMKGNNELIERLNCDELKELEIKLEKGIKSIHRARLKLYEDRILCIACKDNMKNVVIDGCNHFVLCFECSQRLDPKLCPICRYQYCTVRKLKM